LGIDTEPLAHPAITLGLMLLWLHAHQVICWVVVILRCHLVDFEGNLSFELGLNIRNMLELLLLYNWLALVSLLDFLICIVVVLLVPFLLWLPMLIVRLLMGFGITLVTELDWLLLWYWRRQLVLPIVIQIIWELIRHIFWIQLIIQR
jgi:hypothetical protein